MPSPSSALSTLRPDLAGSLEEFDLEANQGGFIALQVLPTLEVGKASGHFGKIPLEQLLQNRDTERAPGSGYSRGKWKFEPDTYATAERGAEEPVDDNEAALYRDYFDAELVSAQRARDAVLMGQEQRVAAAVFNATTFSGQVTSCGSGLEWSDYTNSVPIDDVETAVRAIWSRCGLWPNTLILNRFVFRNLRRSAQIIDAIRSSGAGNPTKAEDVTLAMLAAVFDLPKILVAGGAKNSAAEGQAATIANVWSSEYAMVCVTSDSKDIRRPCLGRTFHWGEDGSSIGGTFESYREEQTRSDIIRCRHQVGEKFLHTAAAQLIDNVTE